MTHEFYDNERPLSVFISGRKGMGEDVLRAMIHNPLVHVAGVCCPIDDRAMGKLADTFGIPRIASGTLRAETFPDGVDLGISAHSFDYVGRATRYRPRIGWIGYHPSLLPRHRGRSSIEWAIRMRDPITGGTVFWLNSGIDRGDILNQDWCFVDPAMFAKDPKEMAAKLWRETLRPMGVRLVAQAVSDIIAGRADRTPQDGRYSTWEPSTDVKDIYRPDLLLLEAHVTGTKQVGNAVS
jgi:methionyl-tRNA formyltransferase